MRNTINQVNRFIIFIVIGLTIIISSVIYSQNIKKENLNALKNYIEEKLNQRNSANDIKNSLLTQGWDDKTIEKAFNQILKTE